MQASDLQLKKGFRSLEAFERPGYQLLPFKVTHLEGSRYVLTNLAGEYLAVGKNDLQALVSHSMTRANPVYLDLKARHFIFEKDSSAAIELLAAKYRTKQAYLREFTALHIFVVSLRCDHSCQYCQVSRV